MIQIRTLGMLRSRFRSLPGAFNSRLIPPEKSEASKRKGFRASLSSKIEEVQILILLYFQTCAKFILASNFMSWLVHISVQLIFICWFFQSPASGSKDSARFAQMWNKIITSFRDEDLISNKYHANLLGIIKLYFIFRLDNSLIFKTGKWICCLFHIQLTGIWMIWILSSGLLSYSLARYSSDR